MSYIFNGVKRFSLILIFIFVYVNGWTADTLQVCSPSGKICVSVWMGKQLFYRISHNNNNITGPSAIDLVLDNKQALSLNNKIKSHSVKKVKETIVSPIPEKRKIIQDIYNKLSLAFRQPYSVEFRVYDDAVTYRISTSFKDSINIKNEIAEFNFSGEPSAYFGEIHQKSNADIFHTSFEELYNLKKMDKFEENAIAFSPLLVIPESNPKIAITESDLEDYPGMFLGGTGAFKLRGRFAGYPLEERIEGGMYSQSVVTKRAEYIARTKGTRSFPWRILMIAEEDKDLPSNDVVYRLASPSRVEDISWVKPGNITDEWIIELNLFNVPFKAGRNTASYKYYIDFAKRFGIDRIMMDAGWSDNNDLLKVIPEIDMDTIVAYAKEKGVKIAMWTLALTLNRQLEEALDQFNKWGIDFIMTDFIDRDDQKTVNFHKRVAEACAAHKIMIMFHGTYPPKGFNRTYPNAVTREAVLGSEYNMGSDKVSPGHDVLLAFTRMLAGSMDYEPGILNNASKGNFRPIGGLVMSPGTRSHQMAMVIVYDSPIQFFSGNPSQAWLEPEYMELLGHVPTTWDETKILDAKVGEYIITARKKGDDWYIGGLTDWTPRNISIKFDFLDDASYNATICKDGVNADRYGADYMLDSFSVKKNDPLTINFAPGGGFFIRLQKQK